MKRFYSILLTLTLLAIVPGTSLAQQGQAAAAAPKSNPLDDLLTRVKASWSTESEENRRREKEFKQKRDQQKQLLAQAKATRDREEKRSNDLEVRFESNEVELAQLETTLTERMGALGELFGVVRQVAGDTRSQVEASIVSAELGGRVKFLEELGKNKSLPSIEALEGLWFTLQQEMTELGKVTRFSTTIVNSEGEKVEAEVIRVGAFNAVANGKYLRWEIDETGAGHLEELPRQPAGTYLDTVASYSSARDGYSRLAIDPSRGAILNMLIKKVNLKERLRQGGAVGYTIIVLGSLAGAIAIFRWLIVVVVARKVAAQKKSDQISDKNPLGRVLGIYDANQTADVETLELKLDEVIMKEASKLDRLLWVVKVVSVVAPLMGLLGTVTGMIRTFQAITLYGTGDPKMMASGISEALVTTMLGLCVAIPLVLLHSLVANSSKGVVETLEEQATGMVAQRAEHHDGAA